MHESNEVYITPELPALARSDIAMWEGQHKKPAFITTVPQLRNRCRNCAGMGHIIINFCDYGPIQHPPNNPHRVAMYWQGSELWPTGWYLVAVEQVGSRSQAKRKSYLCPHCNGQGRSTNYANYQGPPTPRVIRESVEAVGKKLSKADDR